MIDDLVLARLMAWLSPVFPTGSFAYSSGLEAAVSSGLVTDETSLHEWLSSTLTQGRLRNDAIFLAEAIRHHNSTERLNKINDLALGSAGCSELHLETSAQGKAFADALEGWNVAGALSLPDLYSLPVAVGAACGAALIAPRKAIIAYANAFITNQLQIAIRLSVMGQAGASRLLAALEPNMLDLADNVENATLDDLGSATVMVDIMAMRHETQHGRLFRS